MVGLADIPFVGKFVDRVFDKAVDAVFRGFRYVFRYKVLVDQLNSETEKLNIQKEEMSRRVEEEKNNGKIIQENVLTWQKKVEDIQKTGETLSPSSCYILCLPIPNPVSRFRIGRNAAKKTVDVAQLTGTGNDYLDGEIAHLPLVKNMPQSDTAFEEFESRKDAYGKLWDALVNEDSPLVHGIYGMAGVGKTRMMEQLWEDAMKKQIFNKVVRVNVGSENLDEYKLQDQIAARLDCKLESQDVERRASQLENSLRNAGKILLILDDVWSEIRLGHIIGAPFGDDTSSKGSKILLTSRDKRVCEANNCEHPVEVKALSPDEALDLFMKTVGPDKINSVPEQSLVKKVCDECGQLPLLILAVGKALKNKPHNSWVDALVQLQKGKFENIPGVDRRVYRGIRLSIDYLEQNDAKSCLFLCCLFPEDADIDMKMLIQLATGSQLIPDGESRVLAMVDSLKDSSLLLDSGKNHETKVHDIIRDVARDVAFRDRGYAFLQERCTSQYLPSKQKYPTLKLLRLDVETDDVHFYEDVECPYLHTLWLQCNKHTQQFSDGFFQMFANLGWLMLQNVNMSLEKFSLERLGNLRALILLKCDIRNTDVSLFPKKLETLCICHCTLPRPMDVANLEYLRKLEIQVQRWQDRLVMKSNVISSLSRLQELHVPNGFITDLKKYEISEFTRLKSLQFHFYVDHTFQGRDVFSNIDRYRVSVGPYTVHYWEQNWERDGIVPSTKSILLHGNHWQSWEGLMARAEEVMLKNSDVEVSSICNGHRGAFEHLERLYIDECNKMGHLARFSHSLQHGATCFSKLTILKIENCSELKYLFCNKIAKSLAQLQELSVENCKSMEAIIMNEGTTDGEIIIFPRLKSLKMDNVPRLASFYAKKKNVHPGSTVPMDNFAQHHPFFDGMVAFPFLEEMYIEKCDNMRQLASISHDEIQNSLQHGATSFSKLTILRIRNCSQLKYLFCNDIANQLAQLQELIVESCTSMKAIIMNEGMTDGEILIFPRLKLLKMGYVTSFHAKKKNMHPGSTVPMNNSAQHHPFFNGMVAFPFLEEMCIKKCDNRRQLASISQDEIQNSLQHGATSFSKLTILEIESCFQLKYLFCNNIANQLVQLQELSVESCESMEAIIMNEGTSDGEIIIFPRLKSLKIHSLHRLASFYAEKKNMDPGSTLLVDNFAKHQPFFYGMAAFPCLEKLDIYGLPNTSVIWGKDCFNNDNVSSFCKLTHVQLGSCPKLEIVIPQAMLHRLNNLEYVNVYGCSSLRTMFPSSVGTSDLTHLKKLTVRNCEEMREIIEAGESAITDNALLFPEMTELTLLSLPSLTSFWRCEKANNTVRLTLPQLSSIHLGYLPLTRLFHGTNLEFHAPSLKQDKVTVPGCPLLEHIFEDVRVVKIG